MTEPTGFIVQLCPNDHPPFFDICRVYQAAGESLGYKVLTFFLSPATAMQSEETASPDIDYLSAADLSQTRVLARKLEKAVPSGTFHDHHVRCR